MPCISNNTHAYSFSHAFTLQIIDHIKCAFSHATNHTTIQFIRFKRTLLKMCLVYKSHLHSLSSLFHFVYAIHIHDGFRLVNPVLFIIQQCAYTFHNFGFSSCRMLIGAPRHVVFKCHTPSWRMPIGASRQVEHFFNVICHHDECRLVHPTKWDIGQFQGAFKTDANWGIPPGCSFGILIQFNMSRIDQFVYNSINISHAINCQSFQLSHFQIHMHFHNIISKIYSFHIIISDLFGILPKHLK